MTDEITATALATFDVAPNGSHVRLHLQDTTGRRKALVLPMPCVAQLLANLPAMLEETGARPTAAAFQGSC